MFIICNESSLAVTPLGALHIVDSELRGAPKTTDVPTVLPSRRLMTCSTTTPRESPKSWSLVDTMIPYLPTGKLGMPPVSTVITRRAGAVMRSGSMLFAESLPFTNRMLSERSRLLGLKITRLSVLPASFSPLLNHHCVLIAEAPRLIE